MGKPFRLKSESPNDTAAFQGEVDSRSGHLTAAIGEEDSTTLLNQNGPDDTTVYITDVSFKIENGSYAGDGTLTDIECQIYADDPQGNTFYRVYFNPATTNYIHFDPPIKLEPDAFAKLQCFNDTGATLDWGYSLNWRTA